MYYQPRIVDKEGKIKAAVSAIEAETGLKKSVIVAQLLRDGIRRAAKSTPEIKKIMGITPTRKESCHAK